MEQIATLRIEKLPRQKNRLKMGNTTKPMMHLLKIL
jgi:hypothetical protein